MKNGIKKTIAIYAGVISATVLLSSCGDDITVVTNPSMISISSLDELGDCNSNSKGNLVYLDNSDEVYFCADSNWKKINISETKGLDGKDGKDGTNGTNGKDGAKGDKGDDCKGELLDNGNIKITCGSKVVGELKNGTNGKNGENGKDGNNGESCSIKENKEKNGYDLVCGNETVTITNGIDGKNGTNGKDGDNGESCSIKENKEKNGYDLVCGNETVTITNGIDGKNGENGTNGTNGTSCSITNDENGIVTLQCGEGENVVETKLYKAMCEATPYDPETHFCYEKIVYEKCDGKNYDLKTQFCAKRDNVVERIYKKITITVKAKNYSKTWMAENLNYKTTSGSYCYDNNENKCATYGRLYTWATAVGKDEDKCGRGHKCNLGSGKIQGVCPDGWHIPNTTEWEALFDAVGGISTAGKMLKATKYWNNNGNGTDAYGFSALPAGDRNADGGYGNEGHYANIASSTELDSDNSYYMRVYSTLDYARINNYYKDYAFSVRCLQN